MEGEPQYSVATGIIYVYNYTVIIYIYINVLLGKWSSRQDILPLSISIPFQSIGLELIDVQESIGFCQKLVQQRSHISSRRACWEPCLSTAKQWRLQKQHLSTENEELLIDHKCDQG